MAKATICIHCGLVIHANDASEVEIARIYDEMRAHDLVCEKSPLVERIAELEADLADAKTVVAGLNDLLKKEGADCARLREDAERYDFIEALWINGSAKLDCDEDGWFRIDFEGAECADREWKDIGPKQVVDAARKELDAARRERT